ncbi:CORD and CS domain-containing protein [Saccharata proteae CBS 121410]|uniref:CORD and CS domain-containing protein n=1 Tax=Saccharata proteae CBS 121410 TaxID=1314787 RepID=A0A9P4LVD1_9PEZI|nr:CORD and CS domain-containing protein [Saccharata proteae CBS 121410]
MAKKCVHKGCGKSYEADSSNDDCVYHPGPPEFHEGQKNTDADGDQPGWKCCKPRVLTFDEFLAIPPCTTGKHSDIDDTPVPEPQTIAADAPQPVDSLPAPVARLPTRPAAPAAQTPPSKSPAPPEDESDDPSLPIQPGQSCRRRGCGGSYVPDKSREDEKCVHHPGVAIFHEGSKGWSCCKRRVLEFDQFMKIEGCKTRDRHLFVGKGKKGEEEKLETVRHDFYQTPTQVIASLFLKKIEKDASTVEFSSPTTIALDLKTSDKKRYKTEMPLSAPIDTDKSSFKVMGTKLELTLAKADGTSWAVLRADDPRTGEIIQTGRAGRAS